MAGHPHKRVQPGDAFQPNAALHNALVELLGKNKGAAVKDARLEGSVEIWVRNDTGADVPQFGILRVGDPLITPGTSLPGFKNNKLVKGLTPSASAVVAVAQEPIGDGKIGRAVVGGLTQTQIDVGDAAHQYATPTTDPDHMESGATGRFKITYKNSGTGVVWGEILLVQPVTIGEAMIIRVTGTFDATYGVYEVYRRAYDAGPPVTHSDGPKYVGFPVE